jgi:hypothetical protein
MHIQKNMFDNIVNPLLDVEKRSKYNANARLDMKRMKIMEDLHIVLHGLIKKALPWTC